MIVEVMGVEWDCGGEERREVIYVVSVGGMIGIFPIDEKLLERTDGLGFARTEIQDGELSKPGIVETPKER